jgi:hypothetical protein
MMLSSSSPPRRISAGTQKCMSVKIFAARPREGSLVLMRFHATVSMGRFHGMFHATHHTPP